MHFWDNLWIAVMNSFGFLILAVAGTVVATFILKPRSNSKPFGVFILSMVVIVLFHWPQSGSVTITTSLYPVHAGVVSESGVFNKYSLVNLQATPLSGWRFVGWYEEETRVNVDAVWNFSAISDRKVQARFIRHGLGTWDFDDGDMYIGEFYNGHFSGYGVYFLANGGMQIGQWLNSNAHGHSIFVDHYNVVRVVEWANNQDLSYMEMQPVHCIRCDVMKAGEIIYDQSQGYILHGWGIKPWNSSGYITGGTFAGQWINGLRTGYGIDFRTDGSMHIGHWSRNYPHGSGIEIKPNGEIGVIGEWSWGNLASSF